ncbi:MAG: VPS10 domain-containing protein, partial [Vicinamibacterales bacterium]
GRARAVSGAASQPNVAYIGFDNGGVWRSTDYGSTWHPLFDAESTGSIGAIAVAPSDPNIIYVGSGAGIIRPDLATGNGVYKSTDAGHTWTHLGLDDTEMIAMIVVSPRDPNVLFVAALGHPYGPNQERGIYRSTDGGRTFQKVLYKDEYTSGDDVRIDPSDPNIVYAALWQQQQGFWENGSFGGPDGGIFKSTDGGATWKPLTEGLPHVLQANLGISQSNPKTLYAMVAGAAEPGRAGGGRAGRGGLGAGVLDLYRTDDGGEHWHRAVQGANGSSARPTDPRPLVRIGGGDLPTLAVDPKDPNVVYSCSTVFWRSDDGGVTWSAVRGAPGGDDYQKAWVNPNNTNILLVVSDQGAVVSANHGESWSNWYTQPTAAMYHVSTDDAFPYSVCGGQQDSGSACVASRSNDGEITFHDWHPVNIQEYGEAAPDPKNPDLVYGSARTGVSLYNRKTGQTTQVGPSPEMMAGPAGRNSRAVGGVVRGSIAIGGRGGVVSGSAPAMTQPSQPRETFNRNVRTMPIEWSPINPNLLFYAQNAVFKTLDGGNTWTRISGDLTRQTWQVPASAGKYASDVTPGPLGTITALSPSSKDVNILWAGTDDGNIQVTIDGGAKWSNVTPPEIKPWSRIFNIEAGHFDTLTAYAAANTMRIDEMRPHFWRTHDGGKTWTEIDSGIASDSPANSIREDPKEKGLLYAATDTQVWVSYDDGDSWQSLRLNMPAISVRDLELKDDNACLCSDLIAGTHGRGYWILDDVTPLRQAAAIRQAARAGAAYLVKPEPAVRVRFAMNDPTPWPPELPAGENPPPGGTIDYFLGKDATGPVTLAILDTSGKVVRSYSSDDPVPDPDPATDPVAYNRVCQQNPQVADCALPLYWPAPPMVVSTKTGMHRVSWDLHDQPIGGAGGRGGGEGNGAVPHRTYPSVSAPWATPGSYTVRLTVDGKTYSQPLTLHLDPRVKIAPLALSTLNTLTRQMYDGARAAHAAGDRGRALVAELDQATGDDIAAFKAKVSALAPPLPPPG